MNPQIGSKTVLVLNLEHIAQLYFRTDPWRVEAVEQPMGFGISNEAPYIAALGKRAMELLLDERFRRLDLVAARHPQHAP